MNIPCRVMGDLARHEADLRDNIPEVFDENTNEHVEAVVGKDLAAAIQQLLLTRREIKLTNGSFGADAKVVANWVEQDLDKLYERCKEIWRDL